MTFGVLIRLASKQSVLGKGLQFYEYAENFRLWLGSSSRWAHYTLPILEFCIFVINLLGVISHSAIDQIGDLERND